MYFKTLQIPTNLTYTQAGSSRRRSSTTWASSSPAASFCWPASYPVLSICSRGRGTGLLKQQQQWWYNGNTDIQVETILSLKLFPFFRLQVEGASEEAVDCSWRCLSLKLWFTRTKLQNSEQSGGRRVLGSFLSAEVSEVLRFMICDCATSNTSSLTWSTSILGCEIPPSKTSETSAIWNV